MSLVAPQRFVHVDVFYNFYSTARAFLGLPFAYLKRFMRLTGLYIREVLGDDGVF